MPSATLEDIALRSTNPVKRAMDVISVIFLQLLTMMVLATEDPAELSNHPALSAQSMLARLEAGDTFDLPFLLIAAIRLAASQLRTMLQLNGFGFAQASTSIPPESQTPAAPAKATTPAKAARHHPPGAAIRTRRHHAPKPRRRHASRPRQAFSKQQAFPARSIHVHFVAIP